MENVLADIRAERARQDEQWGGPDHDDQHTLADWLECIEYQIAHVREDTADVRERLVKIAALAVAAIEALDRGDWRYRPGTHGGEGATG